VRRTSPIDVRMWAPATPAAIADVIAAALHPDRTQRLATAREFAAALRAARREVGGDDVLRDAGWPGEPSLESGRSRC
jgi:hypothetical protein